MRAHEEFPYSSRLRAEQYRAMCDKIDSLRLQLKDALEGWDRASLASIEARNPGIDMDEVRRVRAGA